MITNLQKIRWKEASKRWALNNPEAYRRSNKRTNLKRIYGITLEDYEEVVELQDGCCKICDNPETEIDYRTGKIKALAVDHCSKTKLVRGIVCQSCNKMLGFAKHDIKVLASAIEYLAWWDEI